MTPAIRLVYSDSKKIESGNSRLRSVRPVMLRTNYSKSPPLLKKMLRVHQERPDLAAVLEKLADDILKEVS